MSQPFLAEVKIFGFNFPPRGWSFCDGQIIPINQNQSLFSLLGTTYGGDGRTTFALPELRGRTPMSTGSNGGLTLALGQKAGEEAHALNVAETPTHSHQAIATNSTGDSNQPTNKLLATVGSALYGPPTSLTPLASTAVKNIGGGQGHNNMAPYLTVNFCIAVQGLFPSRN